MRGPFSAQGVDLHSIWQAYVYRSKFRQLGDLTVSAKGFPLWEGKYGKVAMCQFRDNILVAIDCDSDFCANLVNLIRSILPDNWNLHIDCDCISPKSDKYRGCCCSGVRKAVGVVMVQAPDPTGCAFVEPAALTSQWKLNDAGVYIPLVSAVHTDRCANKRTPLDRFLARPTHECRYMDAGGPP